MTKFVDVSPDELSALRQGSLSRKRVSGPILEAFLQSGKIAARLDRSDIPSQLQTLNSSLNTYARNHNIPVQVSTAKGEIYLTRTDVENGAKMAPKASVSDFDTPPQVDEEIVEDDESFEDDEADLVSAN